MYRMTWVSGLRALDTKRLMGMVPYVCRDGLHTLQALEFETTHVLLNQHVG